MISTDPPYYDNINYSELADYFYIWMRQSLKNSFPSLFQSMMTPKAEELIASAYRHQGSKEKAKDFFENGMLEACSHFYSCVRDDIPLTVYYAYKQQDSADGENETASSGWETMLSAIIKAGFSITGTWPMRTEMANRSIASESAALASSIVLVCRKRSLDAPITTRAKFLNELRRELKPALDKMQDANIAPVDLAQSAIGPGIGVYSKYAQVLEADGKPMTVRAALLLINKELDMYFNEQDGELDAESRFCVDLYTQYCFNDVKYGEADTLARAKNTSVGAMENSGLLYSKQGVVRLLERGDMEAEADWKKGAPVWLAAQRLTLAMDKGGIEQCARLMATMAGDEPAPAKALIYRLHAIAERRGWGKEAMAYNATVSSWADITDRAADIKAHSHDKVQGKLKI